MPEDKKQEIKEEELVEVPTGSAKAFQLEDGTYVDDKVMQLAIYKILKKLEKGLL
jgi:hypothetical protein